MAFVVFPEAFTVIDGTSGRPTAPVSNMSPDLTGPGWVYQSQTVTPSFTVMSQSPTPIDTVNLVHTNLRRFDTVRIRIGSSQAEVDGAAPVDYTIPAWSGPKSDWTKPITSLRLPAPVFGKYVRVDIISTGNPDGFVQICYLAIGSSATNSFRAIGQDAEVGINDPSESTDFRGGIAMDKFTKGQTFKASFGWIGETQYRRDWHRTLANAGNSTPILLIPSYELKTNPNMIRDSQSFLTAWSSTGSPSWSRNADYGHDGAMTAAIMEDSSTDSAANFYQNISILPDVQSYTVSAFVKKAVGTTVARIGIELAGGTTSHTSYVGVNPATGATNFTSNSNIEDAGEYWRAWRSFVNTGGNTTVRIRLYPAINAVGAPLNTSLNAAVGQNTFSGPQVEVGDVMTPWAPTSAASANDTHYADFQQNDAVFGYVSKASPKWSAPSWWNVEIQVNSQGL